MTSSKPVIFLLSRYSVIKSCVYGRENNFVELKWKTQLFYPLAETLSQTVGYSMTFLMLSLSPGWF